MLSEFPDSGCNLDMTNCGDIDSNYVFVGNRNSENGLVSTKEPLFNIIHQLDPVPRRDKLCFCNNVDELVTVLNKPCILCCISVFCKSKYSVYPLLAIFWRGGGKFWLKMLPFYLVCWHSTPTAGVYIFHRAV